MGMNSRRRQKKKAIRMLNKQLAEEKDYRALNANKRLMRFLKESGRFTSFIGLVRKKHHIGFQAAINLIKSNPEIYFLIGHTTDHWTQLGFTSQYTRVIGYDETTQWYIDNFNKYRPLC